MYPLWSVSIRYIPHAAVGESGNASLICERLLERVRSESAHLWRRFSSEVYRNCGYAQYISDVLRSTIILRVVLLVRMLYRKSVQLNWITVERESKSTWRKQLRNSGLRSVCRIWTPSPPPPPKPHLLPKPWILINHRSKLTLMVC